MKFQHLKSQDALHAILAHTQKLSDGRKISKGTALTQKDIDDLQTANIKTVAVITLTTNDVSENIAATAVATAVCGANINAAKAIHGRVNLFANSDGVLCYAPAQLQALNCESPTITLATLPPFARVSKGQMIATIKIIPYAAPQNAVDAMQQYSQLLSVHPFHKKTAVLIQTISDASHERIADKTQRITAQRLNLRNCTLYSEWRCAHNAQDISKTLATIQQKIQPDLTLLAGASAVCDIEDVAPAAVVASGGNITRFGMPADPGNLLVLGEWQNAPCIILPGCARSPKHNGLDMILDRILADLPITANDIAAMGAGGLLEDTTARPTPRQTRRPNIGALLLAAGTSSRMQGKNKLLTSWCDKPLITHAAKTLSEVRQNKLIQQTAVVCGHNAADVMNVIAEFDLPAVINRDYATGMASSIACGMRALDLAQLDGVLVLLGDMPLVTADDICAVIDTFAVSNNITAATHNNKRGNPVLFAQRHFTAMLNLSGDVGARVLFAEESISEATASAGVLFDLDSPDAFNNATNS